MSQLLKTLGALCALGLTCSALSQTIPAPPAPPATTTISAQTGTITPVGGTDPSTLPSSFATAMATDSPWSGSFCFATTGQPFALVLYSPKNFDLGKGWTWGFNTGTGASLDKSTTLTACLGLDLAKDFGSTLSLFISLDGGIGTSANQKPQSLGLLSIGLKGSF